jgi:hypothetical protein
MKMILLVLTLLSLASCGTETGNPEATSGEGDQNLPQSGYQDTITGSIATLACQKVSSCYSVTQETCLENIGTQDNFDQVLGLPDATYTNLLGVVFAEKNGSIIANTINSDNCKSDISNLNCSDQEVQDAFSNSSPNDFSKIYKVLPQIPGNCDSVF